MLGDIYGEENRPLATAILTTAFSIGQIIGTLIAGFTTNIQAGFLTWLETLFPSCLSSKYPSCYFILFNSS